MIIIIDTESNEKTLVDTITFKDAMKLVAAIEEDTGELPRLGIFVDMYGGIYSEDDKEYVGFEKITL